LLKFPLTPENWSSAPGAAFGSGLTWRATVFSLALGSIGGAIFWRIGMPLAWMLGAMITLTVVAVAHGPVRLPQRLRSVMVAVLGVMLGSSFSPDLLPHAGKWLISLSCLVPYLLIASGLTYVYFRKVAAYDPATAFFSGTPGGLSVMTLIGTDLGGDSRSISLAHAARILLVVSTIPFWFQIARAYDPALNAGLARVYLSDVSLLDVTALGLCALVGAAIGNAIRLPAAALTGPMLISAAVHLAGWTSSVPPVEAVAAAQVVLGTAIGCRFAGTNVGTVVKAIVLALGALAILLVVAVGFALGLAWVTGLSFDALLLAYAPGGLAEMTLIALSQHIDPAFVGAHHVVRIALIVTAAPLVFRVWIGHNRRAR
jgi:hypothetical protein